MPSCPAQRTPYACSQPNPRRYDKLVGMFSGKEVPAVGVSIGIERVFAIMEAQLRAQAEAVSSWVAAFLASSCCSPLGVRVPSWQRSGHAQAGAVGV